ncbi:VCBS domain-containing protein [Thalassotalea euphylliae]|uniref:VCBS domain-containing protein n=1 Tax=Thalassotalea euphylliae TaxID=1655234 RepID=UPI0036393386
MKIQMNKKVAMAAMVLAIAGCDSDSLPDKNGNSFGQLALSGTPLVGETLTATVTDANGVDGSAISYTWMADDAEISGASGSTLVLTDAQVGASISVSVAYTDNDDYEERIKSSGTSAVAGVDVPATFSGLTASVANNVTEALTGMVVIQDDDPGEDIAEPQSDVVTTFGVFSIDATGAWVYTLDTTNSTISSLVDENDTVTDTIAIASVDGTAAELVITIFGAPNTGGGEPTQVARITDNMTDDAGELRLKLDSAVAQGKLTVSFLKEDNAVTADGVAKDAYIGLFGESTSTSNAIVDLRIQADKFVIRDKDDIEVTIPFIPDVWTDVEMTWDASAASDSVAPLVTITINGTSVTTEAFSSASSSLSDVMTGMRHVIFKLGDNGSTIPDAAYFVDNVKLYSDLAGTAVLFEDDFESYADGVSLDTDNADSPYNSSTAETVVDTIDGPGTGAGVQNPDNQVAQITDNMTDDAGELRYKADAGIPQGKLTVSFFKEDNATNADGVAKDAYIGLFGESTSTSNAIVDLRIQANKFVIRDKDDIEVTIPFVPDVWTDVEMTWDASAASASVAPLVTVTINGTSVTTEAFSSASSSLSDVMTGVRYAIFKLGDNSSTIPAAAYFVDDVKLYSDMAGTAIVFEDDFEGYAEGDSLDTDNAASPYNSNSAEVVVAVKGK